MGLAGMIKGYVAKRRNERLHNLGLFENALVDEYDTRDWTMIRDLDDAEARRLFPDFDVAYTRAVEDTGKISESEMQRLEEALPKCLTKSFILSYMFMYYRARGDWLRTFEYAVRTTVAMGRPGFARHGISVERSDALHLVETVFRLSHEEETARMIHEKYFGHRLELRPEDARKIHQLAAAIRNQKAFFDIMYPAKFKLDGVCAK